MTIFALPNGLRLSGARKGVRCSRGLDGDRLPRKCTSPLKPDDHSGAKKEYRGPKGYVRDNSSEKRQWQINLREYPKKPEASKCAYNAEHTKPLQSRSLGKLEKTQNRQGGAYP